MARGRCAERELERIKAADDAAFGFEQLNAGNPEIKRVQRLRRELSGASKPACAFNKLVREGMDREWLLRTLCDLKHHPVRKSRALLGAAAKDMERLAHNLGKVAKEMRRIGQYTADVPIPKNQDPDLIAPKALLPRFPGSSIDLLGAADQCDAARTFLEELNQFMKPRLWCNDGHFQIRLMARKVWKTTRRTYYPEIALLVTEAYEHDPSFSASRIDMIVNRDVNHKRQKK